MTFTSEEIEELEREGWSRFEDFDEFYKPWRVASSEFDLRLFKLMKSTTFAVVIKSRNSKNTSASVFSTLQELREFFGLGVEG